MASSHEPDTAQSTSNVASNQSSATTGTAENILRTNPSTIQFEATTGLLDELEDSDEDCSRVGDRRSGRRKIKIEYIEDKSRRHITFSKRKAGIMKKAYELSTLTGTQVLLLVASETGHVYTFATPKLQPLITKQEGKNLIQACLNSPDHSVIPEYTAPTITTTPNNSTIYETANESAEDDHPRSASTSFAAAIAGLSAGGYPQYLPNGSQTPSPATGVSSSSASSISSAAAAAAAAASQVFMNPQSSMAYSTYAQNGGGAYWNGTGTGFNTSGHQAKSNPSVASLHQQQQQMYHTMLQQQQQLYQQYNSQQQQQTHPLLGVQQHSNNVNTDNTEHHQDNIDTHEM